MRGKLDHMQMEPSFDPGAYLAGSAEQRPHEVRCAVRFPLALPAVLAIGDQEVDALTRDVSASGVLFQLDRPLDAGVEIRFSLRMPHAVLGAPHDVLVHCIGRVVRCSKSQSNFLAASTIDDYEFAEQ